MADKEYLELLDTTLAMARFAKKRAMLSTDPATAASVAEIIQTVYNEGDRALIKYAEKFDRFTLIPGSFRINSADIQAAGSNLDRNLKNAMDIAAERIHDYHRRQQQSSWFFTENGTFLGQLINPLDSAGLYVPGGKAAYPSTVLMNVIPAQIAGVQRIVLCTPPSKDGTVPESILYAAKICGVTEIYPLGGAQAVAAMAYGTESIAAVDKICGPGNRFVAEAKRQVFGAVDIDMIAGPSEILVYADHNSDPVLIAADLFSQAEHDEDARVILVTESSGLVAEVETAINTLLQDAPRKDLIEQSLKNNGIAVLVKSVDEAYAVINSCAPEHLEILAARPLEEIANRVKHAGAVFIGNWSPEPIGDYLAGPNHTLPTSGTARFASPLGVYDFIKRSSIIQFSKEAFLKMGPDAAVFAEAEGLAAHAASIQLRLRNN